MRTSDDSARSTRPRLGLILMILLVALVVAGGILFNSWVNTGNTGIAMLEEGKYDEALQLLSKLWHNPLIDVTEGVGKALQGLEDQAQARVDAQDWDGALSAYKDLSQYYEQTFRDLAGAGERAQYCRYARANCLFMMEKYDDASAQFQQLGSYMDSVDRALQCHRAKADAYFEKQKYANAAEQYILAGEDADTSDLLKECYILQADAMLHLKLYSQAEEWYRKAGDPRVDSCAVLGEIAATNDQYLLGDRRLIVRKGTFYLWEDRTGPTENLYGMAYTELGQGGYVTASASTILGMLTNGAVCLPQAQQELVEQEFPTPEATPDYQYISTVDATATPKPTKRR